jgi:peroxiredoxin
LNDGSPKTLGTAVPPEHVGLPVGRPAPKFQLANLEERTVTLDELLAENRLTLLAFIDPGCGPCNSLLPYIGEWQRDYADKVTFAVITRGTPEANRSKAAEYHLKNVLLQKGHEVASAYQASATPAMVAVRPDGAISSRTAFGVPAILQMLERLGGLRPRGGAPASGKRTDSLNNDEVRTVSGEPTGLRIGSEAPQLELPSLDGKHISIRGFIGKNTIVLFWNPMCGFCKKMLAELKAWETNSTKRAPNLLVVSTGTVEMNQGMGLQSPVVLQSDFAAASAWALVARPRRSWLTMKARLPRSSR